MPVAALILYHGTDLASAERLLAGEPLDAAVAASRKKDGPPGFYLATHHGDAAAFAVRRRPPVVVRVAIAAAAVEALAAAGCALRPIPHTVGSPGFSGREMRIPPEAFALFNALRIRGDVTFSPT